MTVSQQLALLTDIEDTEELSDLNIPTALQALQAAHNLSLGVITEVVPPIHS